MNDPITDTSKMAFGIHFGKPMKDVPLPYLRWLFTRGHKSCPDDLRPYIESRLAAKTPDLKTADKRPERTMPSDTDMLEWLDKHPRQTCSEWGVFTFNFRMKKPFKNPPTLIEAIQRAMMEEQTTGKMDSTSSPPVPALPSAL